ncbi:hydroxylamine reductase [Candidatus Methanomassiliicoccus intestinalis]|uniref:Hydroxylamine reductase n=1 Tax=Methanomassiliicoccus intestinalis (strain Issoire-Mx1) TaxID=1295009 RepID=R9T7I3_METII|nr:hydroxylamine reductase [Candidatus Methanomassiliicoccus intestinalis]AGN26614.1 hybrid cluster protein [Candidatus Methanomassiliicoccus intestinalis Issoire-Mx1]
MDGKMFCFQCEQTAGCKGCTGENGVCGKSFMVANTQDSLTQALIDLSLSLNGKEPNDNQRRLMLEGLFTTITNVNFDCEKITALTKEINSQFPNTNSEDTYSDHSLQLWAETEDIRSLKSLILFGLRGMAAYAYHAAMLGYQDDKISDFFFEGLRAVGNPEANMNGLLPIVMEVGKVNLRCMELLDKANTETYGTPIPSTVSLTVNKGPFIVITGHDLKDLKLLLEQTEGKGINIYTHGEMLPAHAYPELKKYGHLKGNFGTAWQNQKKEFSDIPAPILFTTNCLMPPKHSYSDRVFTTGAVSFPETIHIDEDKDFTPVIQKALELGGYEKDVEFAGINGGKEVTTGFGHATVLSIADKVINAIKDGQIKHIFLVAGCDGAKPERSYYTNFVKLTPSDSIALTLACGKYRFNDLDLGTVAGIPRILDMGQCNDAYSAIHVAVKLAETLNCSVNDLPISFVISWYEQKAVSILLTLLYLGIKNIRLGPSIPAFMSPNVLTYLVENFGIAPITVPEDDMKDLLKQA